MNTIKIAVLAAVAAISTSALAGWSFSAGYAWRQQADTSFKGGKTAQTAPGGVYDDGRANLGAIAADGYYDWDGGTFVGIPSRTVVGKDEYALALNRKEAVAAGGDEEGAHGLTLSAGYGFYETEAFELAAVLRFAGYWGLGNGGRGGYADYDDTYRFGGGLLVDEGVLPARDNYDRLDTYEGRSYRAGGPDGRIRLKSDLYQIGFGPKVTWHVFSCLDVYGGVEALCTFVNSELDAGGARADEVNCLWGVGGHVGFTGWVTENVGFFGQVGYEWIDEDDVSAKGVSAKTDYSSLVLSAGVQVRF